MVLVCLPILVQADEYHAEMAGYILQTMGYNERTVELAKIAGYLHDIGNLVNRKDHSQSGAVMAWSILNDMGSDPAEVATIVTAIGNHDEGTGGSRERGSCRHVSGRQSGCTPQPCPE